MVFGKNEPIDVKFKPCKHLKAEKAVFCEKMNEPIWLTIPDLRRAAQSSAARDKAGRPLEGQFYIRTREQYNHSERAAEGQAADGGARLHSILSNAQAVRRPYELG